MKHAIGKTDVGKKRERNEDFIIVKNDIHGPLKNLFVLADGMGGHNAGDVASESATAYFCEYLESKDINFVYIEDLLADALRYANKKLHEKANETEECFGMGTTFTAASFDDKNLYYAHVGDSRIYCTLTDGFMRQITKDHSLVNEMLSEGSITEEEAKNHPRRNVLTRAVGTDVAVSVDKGYFVLEDVENVLLCSDGLTDMLDDDMIFDIIKSENDLEKCTDKLVNAANEAGGVDNISVILI